MEKKHSSMPRLLSGRHVTLSESAEAVPFAEERERRHGAATSRCPPDAAMIIVGVQPCPSSQAMPDGSLERRWRCRPPEGQ